MGLGSVLGNIGSAITGRRPSAMTPPFLMSPQQQAPMTNPPSVEDDQDPPVYDPNTEDAPPNVRSIGAAMGNAGPMTTPPAPPAPAASSPAPPAAAPPPAVKTTPASAPLPTPPPLPNTPGGQHISLGRKIAGAAIEGASMLMPPAAPLAHMLGQKLSMGGDYLQQQKVYQQQMGQREAQADLESKTEGTAGLKEQRLATAEQRRALGEDYKARETERQNKIVADKQIADAKQKQAQYAVKVKGREDSVIPILQGENAPPGWQVIEHPDGGQVAVPPSMTTVPEQLVPYMPGRKAGDVIGMGEYKEAVKVYRDELSKRNVQDNKPDKDPANEVGLALAAARGDKDAQAALKSIQAGKQTAGIQLTPEAIQFWAQSAAQGNALPSLGMGATGAKAREQIINAAPGAAGGRSLSENKTTLHADSGSLASMQKMRDTVSAFEKTALANLDLFTKQAKTVVDAGSPWINTPLRKVDLNALGSEDLAAYNAARQVALTEIAKVVNNPNLAGQLSDSARHEVTGLIPENATLGQIYRVVGILKQDMANRKKFLDEGIGEIKGRISGGGQGNAQGPAVGDTQQHNGDTYKFDGSQWVKQVKTGGGGRGGR